MPRREKVEVFFFGSLLGFFFIELMEEQQQSINRLRALRQKIQAINGLETDAERLKNDWQNVRTDLQNASRKALSGLALNETC